MAEKLPALEALVLSQDWTCDGDLISTSPLWSPSLTELEMSFARVKEIFLPDGSTIFKGLPQV